MSRREFYSPIPDFAFVTGFGNGGEERQKRRQINVPGYNGEDRRHGGGKRSSDKIAENIKLVAVVLGIALTVFSAGGGYMAAKLAVDGKVSKEDFAAKNAQQDQERIMLLNRVERLETLALDQAKSFMRMENRLKDIYCEGKPPGCQ